MGNSYIYSYRLTYFGGTAPCYDNGLLSLAICKRDMRRVIGRGYINAKKNRKNDEYWFVGIVGNISGDNQDCFKDKYDDVLYVAKVTDVKEYFEYFTEDNTRADCIYESITTESDYKSGNLYFRHKGKLCLVHDEKWLQDRDWDIDSKQPKFVLISDKYRFVEKEESDIIKELVNGRKWANGIGHRWFSDDDYKLTNHFNELVSKCEGNHGIPDALLGAKHCAGCGNKKEDTI